MQMRLLLTQHQFADAARLSLRCNWCRQNGHSEMLHPPGNGPNFRCMVVFTGWARGTDLPVAANAPKSTP